MQKPDESEQLLEQGIGLIYTAFFRMRKNEEYQREYDSMGTILNMLSQDRSHMREKYKIKI